MRYKRIKEEGFFVIKRICILCEKGEIDLSLPTHHKLCEPCAIIAPTYYCAECGLTFKSNHDRKVCYQCTKKGLFKTI